MKPLYLDYAATTPVSPEVAAAMAACLSLDGLFANPSSDHALGKLAASAVAQATSELAQLLGCDVEELVFTSGATEANNLAIKGALEFYGGRVAQPHIITSNIEHKAVLDVVEYLQEQGAAVTRLAPDANGVIGAQQVADALTENTVLVSIQQVNNELGCVQPIAEIATVLKDHSARLHVDAAQSVGKMAVDVRALGVDYLSLSAHKFYGPKGIGALYMRQAPRARLRPQIHGGAQQQGLRSGTLPVHQIVGLGKAAEWQRQHLAAESARLANLQQALEQGLKNITGVTINAVGAERVPHICNVSFEGIAGSGLRAELPDLMVASGSACTSDNGEPSYVLRALGHSDRLAEASLRISFGRYSSLDDVETALSQIVEAVSKLRALSPWWQPGEAERVVSQVSAAWGDEVKLLGSADLSDVRWQAAGRPELLVMLPPALEYFQRHRSVTGLLAFLEKQFELAPSNRYLLLLVEDAFTALMD